MFRRATAEVRSRLAQKRNDFHHLRHAYIHLFIKPICRISEYVTGTSPGAPIQRTHPAAPSSSGGLWILRRMLAEVVEASWQVPNQPK